MAINNSYFLGVDIGSSFTKLIVIDKDGEIVSSDILKL